MESSTLNYKVFGNGQPLVILHGLFGSLDNWQTIAKQIAEKGFEVFILDQRNHGNSFHSNEWTYEVMANDLKTFCEQQNLEQIVLVGHSMGGKVAMHFTVNFPEFVKKLVVVDIAPKLYNRHHDTVLEAINSLNLEGLKSRSEAEKHFQEYEMDFATRQFLLKNLYWQTPEKLDWKFNRKAITEQYDNISINSVESEKCTTETLFIRGENSGYIKDSDWDNILEIFPNAFLETINDAGHWVHAENPEEFLKKILAFIS